MSGFIRKKRGFSPTHGKASKHMQVGLTPDLIAGEAQHRQCATTRFAPAR